MGLHTVDSVGMLMIAVKAKFIWNVKDQEYCSGDAQGHPHDIQETVAEFMSNIAEGVFDKTFKHSAEFRWSGVIAEMYIKQVTLKS